MKKNKLAIGLGLTILVAVGGGGLANAADSAKHAKPDVTKTQDQKDKEGDSAQTQNSRQETKHSQRKAAARRLKLNYEKTEAARIVQPAESEHGNGQKRGTK